MIKRFLSIIVAMSLVFGLFAVAAAADELTSEATESEALMQTPDDGIALIDDATYTWSGDNSALTDSEGTITIFGDGTLTLSADTTANIVISSGTVTLELGSYALTPQSVSKDTIEVKIGASLTVNGNGTVYAPNKSYAALYNSGTVIINGGTYTVRTEQTDVWYLICNHGTMTIKDGTFNQGSVTTTSSLIENGYSSYTSTSERNGYVSGTNAEAPSLEIEGGTFEANGLNAVKNDEGSILVINDGTFTGENSGVSAVIMNWNYATINGGTFNGNSTYAVISNGTYGEHAVGKFTITGGTFTGTNITNMFWYGSGSGNDWTYEISGGTFDGTTENYNNFDIGILQNYATVAAKLSTDDDCYYVGADAIKAAVEAYAGTDELTLTVISGDLSLDVDVDIYVVNSGTGSVTVNGVTIPAETSDPTEVHNLTHVDAVEATCTEDGNIEYWYCENCGKYFADENATEEISEEDTVIAATGHVWGDVSWSWDTSKENIGAKASWTCSVCGNVYTTTDVTVTSSVDGDITTYNLSAVGPDGETYTTTFTVGGGVSDPNDGTDTPETPTTETEPGPVAPPTGAPQTGDTTNMGLWIALFAIALAGMAGACIAHKRRGYSRKYTKK